MKNNLKTTVKTLAIVCIASFVFMGGCLKKLTSVKFNYHSEATFITDSLSTVGNQTFGSSVVTSDLKKEVEDNGSSIDMLDELKLKSAELSFTGPDSAKKFDDVESFELWLSATGLPTIKLASKNPVANGLSTVKLDVSNNDDLVQYIKATTFTYEVKGKNSAALLPVHLKINAEFEAKASAK